MKRASGLLAIITALLFAASAWASGVLSVENFFGEMTFTQDSDGGFINGFIQFNPDHTWYRVEHLDTNRDQVPENVTVERGTYRVVKPENGDPVLALTLENGKEYGSPENLVFISGVVETFTLKGFSYKRRKGDAPYFDQKENKKPLAAALEITSEPSGIGILIDGKQQKGFTPMTVTKPTAGEEHVIRAEKQGYLPQVRTIVLREGERINVHFKMSEGRTMLQAKSRPRTYVTVDGVKKGFTPVKITDLAQGDHVVVLDLPMIGIRYEEKVQVSPEKSVTVEHDFLGKVVIDVGRPVKIRDTQDRLLGEAPGLPLELPVGNHALSLFDAKGKKKTVMITVNLDQTTTFDTPFDDIR